VPAQADVVRTNDYVNAAKGVATVPYTDKVDLLTASVSTAGPAHCANSSIGANHGTPQNTIWYQYTAAKSESLDASLRLNGNSSYAAAFIGTPENLHLVACDADRNQAGSVRFNAVQGTTYYIEFGIDGRSSPLSEHTPATVVIQSSSAAVTGSLELTSTSPIQVTRSWDIVGELYLYQEVQKPDIQVKITCPSTYVYVTATITQGTSKLSQLREIYCPNVTYAGSLNLSFVGVLQPQLADGSATVALTASTSVTGSPTFAETGNLAVTLDVVRVR